MLKTYQTCPRKFYFTYVERVNVPRLSTPFEKGKKIHALANYYLSGIDISQIETALTPEERAVWQTLLANLYFLKKCLKSEYQLSCKISNFWIGGRLDAVMCEGEKYYILDYKTGSTPKNAQYDYQTMTYLLCLDRHLKNYESLEFVYINLKDNRDDVITFTPQLKNEYGKMITKICEKINSDKLYKPLCENCKTCEYNGFCTKDL
jgi:CRISPR/Cas system-associated exonuclease Cas4 (RecB family)